MDWFRDNVDADIALVFVDALDAVLVHVSRHGTGSPRYATGLDVPGLRTWLLDGVPLLVFYVVRVDHVDVWRVLHARMALGMAHGHVRSGNTKRPETPAYGCLGP